ncbi:MAG: hypothetical protein IJV67_06690 [Clostridia bacterium]|nr:hypothetical protein [Clostridia bacterium]
MELDPHFFSQNVGLTGTSKIGAWECKESDWELFEQRIKDMKLGRIRMMLLPSWFVINEANTEAGIYKWDTPEMNSVYRVLDTAKENGIKVNVTMWGVDNGSAGFMRLPGDSNWTSIPDAKYEGLFVNCFADCIKYLIYEKKYDNIKEVTLFNEPNSIYGFPAYSKGNDDYCDLCIKMHDAFEEKGVRDDVLFNLSDDARDYTWMARTLMRLEGVVDVVNSHTYDFGDSFDETTGLPNYDMSNNDICYNNATYNLENWRMFFSEYDVPHIWGEFGTQNGVGSHTTIDKFSPSRGLDIPRISLNFFNMGSVGMSYWVLFSQYYSRGDFNIGKIMDMGLWGFADEGYNCRPVYYSYSMITRFIDEGDVIFPIKSDDENIVAVAFRKGDKWSYAIVNNGFSEKKVAFVNLDSYPATLSRYEYDEANVPTDNNVIAANGSVTADGRVIADTVKGRSFVIYTNK